MCTFWKSPYSHRERHHLQAPGHARASCGSSCAGGSSPTCPTSHTAPTAPTHTPRQTIGETRCGYTTPPQGAQRATVQKVLAVAFKAVSAVTVVAVWLLCPAGARRKRCSAACNSTRDMHSTALMSCLVCVWCVLSKYTRHIGHALDSTDAMLGVGLVCAFKIHTCT